MRIVPDFLFFGLVYTLRPDLILDVGSMDGSHALLFRRLAPRARILAFEANPENFREMAASRRLATARIETVQRVVSDRAGTTTFHTLQMGGPADAWRKGASSIHHRVANSACQETPVQVESTRLDDFLSADTAAQRIAVWIDVEGAAYEAVSGLERITERVAFLQLEVETEPYWEEQRLQADVDGLLRRLGFVEVCSDARPGSTQFNVLYVHSLVLAQRASRIRLARVIAAVLEGVYRLRRAFQSK